MAALQITDALLPLLLQHLNVGFALGIARRVAAVFVHAQIHAFQIARQMRPLAPRRFAGKACVYQVLQLLLQYLFERVFLQTQHQGRVFLRHFQQVFVQGFFHRRQTAARALDLFFEIFVVARQIVVADEGALAHGAGDVVAQRVHAQVFEQHGHLGEGSEAFVQVFDLVFELLGHQRNHAVVMRFIGRALGVEQFQGNAVIALDLQTQIAG